MNRWLVGSGIPRRTSCARRVRRGRRAADSAADGQRSGVGFSSAARCDGRSACPTSRPDRRGTTATSNRSTTDYARSASTATTGPPVRGPSGDRRLQNTSTTTDTGIRPWATERRPSTLRHGIPTPRWPARSTESETQQPDPNSGWTQQRGLASQFGGGPRTCVRAVEEAARDCRRFLQSAQGVGGFGFEFVLAGDAGLADAVVFDVLPQPFVRSNRPIAFQGLSNADDRTRKAAGPVPRCCRRTGTKVSHITRA